MKTSKRCSLEYEKTFLKHLRVEITVQDMQCMKVIVKLIQKQPPE